MSIFLFLLLIVAFASFLELFSNIDKKSKLAIFLSLLFVYYCLSFLRWEYGLDWDGYYRMFQVFSWGDIEGHEPIFSYIIVLGKSIANSYTFVLFLFSTILFYCQYKGIKELSVLPLTSLLYLAGTYGCNVGYVRQYIAVGITFISIIFIRERKLLPYLLCVVIAYGFHYSALAFLPAYWIYNLKLSRKKMLIILLASVFLSTIMSSFLQGFGNLLGVAGIADRADLYIDEGYDYDDGYADPYQIIIRACINRSFIFLILFYIMGKLSKTQFNLHGLCNLYWFGSILFFMTCPLHITLARMSWYYDFTQIIIVPSIFLFVKNKYNKLLLYILLTILMIVKVHMAANMSDNEMFTKYKFIPEIENIFQ